MWAKKKHILGAASLYVYHNEGGGWNKSDSRRAFLTSVMLPVVTAAALTYGLGLPPLQQAPALRTCLAAPRSAYVTCLFGSKVAQHRLAALALATALATTPLHDAALADVSSALAKYKATEVELYPEATLSRSVKVGVTQADLRGLKPVTYKDKISAPPPTSAPASAPAPPATTPASKKANAGEGIKAAKFKATMPAR